MQPGENKGFKRLSMQEKALQINLNTRIYGTFAEIGAGQEVAAQFFKAGLASGSIAKTISAYDMTFSDSIYGPCARYVCRERLYQMLDKEYSLLEKRLAFRTKKSTFFAFANTVETANPLNNHVGHGWVGVRFQLYPNTAPNDCILHVFLKDREVTWQQEALAAIGVNLLYACYHHADPEAFILSLMDNTHRESIEIDMFKLKGANFTHIDNRLMSFKLVKHELTKATMFGPDGGVLQAAEALHKKDVLVLRGRFKPVTHVNVDMMLGAYKQFKKEQDVNAENIITLSELTLNDMAYEKGEIDELDFLERVDILCSLGQNVLVSNYQEYYKLIEYISGFTNEQKIGIILGYHNLEKVFDRSYYRDLPGGLLEAFGKLFSGNTKLYVYPCLNGEGGTYTCKDISPGKELKHLFTYLHMRGKIADIKHFNKDIMHIISDKVLQMIQEGGTHWEQYVPHKVARAIKEQSLFNYPSPIVIDKED